MLILKAILFCLCFVGYNFSFLDLNDAVKPHFRYDYDYNLNGGGWFKLHTIRATWHEARKRCKYEGAELAEPLTRPILEAMVDIMRPRVFDVFIGVHSIFSYGDYYSISGVPLEKMPVRWLPMGPELDRDKRCVVLSSKPDIKNEKCEDVSYPFICYKKEDGISLTSCGTTNKGYSFVPELNACYKCDATIKSWRDSYMSCSAEGGHLAVINSKEELTHVKKLINGHPESIGSYSEGDGYGVYIGVVNWGSKEWTTIHGDDLEGNNLLLWEGNIDYMDTNELCASLSSDGFLSPMTCEYKRRFVCEKKPDSLDADEEYLRNLRE